MKLIPFIYKDIDDLCSNTYVLIDNSNNCVVIDPSRKYDGLVNYIKKNNLNLKAVLLTHSHVDHFRGAEILLKTFNVPLYIGFNDAPGLKDLYLNCGYFLDEDTILDIEPVTICEQDTLNLLDEPIKILDTPYHTLGGVCYYLKDSGILFSGDSLFFESVGRSDLPSSNIKKQLDSIRKILSLPKETVVYPGHGKSTTIEHEKETFRYI